MNKKNRKEEKYSYWDYLITPKKRTVIYGVTDRRDDPWYLKLNDFLLDRESISLKEKSQFFHSLKLLVSSSIPFIKALNMLSRRSKTVAFSRILATIAYDMENHGLNFSKSIEKYPYVFNHSDIRMIYSGEITGKIDKTLDSIATQIQKNVELEIKIKSALMYPFTVLIAIVLATIAIMVFIVPKLSDLFTQFGSQLPFATRSLIGISNFVIEYWWLLLTAIVFIITVTKSWLRSEKGNETKDVFLLKIPVIANIINAIQVSRISSNLATLTESGITINKSLGILSEIIPNRFIGKAILRVKEDVEQGVILSEAFDNQKSIDSIIPEIIEVGEKTGDIALPLKKLASQYDLEVDSQIKNISTAIEPLIIVLVGGAVVFMIFAVISPIFQIQNFFS